MKTSNNFILLFSPISLFAFLFISIISVELNAQCPDFTGWTELQVAHDGDDVKISGNTFVQGNKSYKRIGKLTIPMGAVLAFKNETINLTVNQIHVMGTLQIGTEQCPIDSDNKVTLTFDKGSNFIDTSDLELMVMQQGKLLMYGKRGVVEKGGTSWTHMTKPAGPVDKYGAGTGVKEPVAAEDDALILHVANDVSKDWHEDDWIMVATTDFVSHHTEFVQIDDVDKEGTGSLIRLHKATPLRYYHFGHLAPNKDTYMDGPDRNFGIDERGEVGLVSRNIKLTAVVGNSHKGGDIHIMQDFGEVHIQGVEIEQFGKDELGNYPIHFHKCGDVSGKAFIHSNSIHHSYNKAVTVHGTSGVEVNNNVAARIIGHCYFLEDGNEENNTFDNNLAAGAMCANFQPTKNIDQYWDGDYLVESSLITYDAGSVGGTNALISDKEAPSGFWITNPSNTFTNNSVAGCEGRGRGYWIICATPEIAMKKTLTKFHNNRVHGAYMGLDNSSNVDIGAPGANHTPLDADGNDLITTYSFITATRNRNIGIWLRPAWNIVDNARCAMNRQGASLVSSGGVEGSAPGVWALLSNSVFAGFSRNNVERFGPCGTSDCFGMKDFTLGRGYVDPTWNTYGYMFYDGPARLEKVRLVNFKKNSYEFLTKADSIILKNWETKEGLRYEGDAGFGWFQANVNAYPPTQYTKELFWENTDFRHQVYTEETNMDQFKDGDKNTVILDVDGTLTGFMVSDATGNRVLGRYPVSLNNLPFLSSPLTVDECLSIGQQNEDNTGRETSLISPHDYATLETVVFYGDTGIDNKVEGTVFGDGKNDNILTFKKDVKDFGKHQSMEMEGRNQTGVYEPKVMDRLSYTIHGTKGMSPYTSIGLADVGKPNISATNPFVVRVGICYNSEGGTKPTASDFVIQKGRKSMGSPIVNGQILETEDKWRFDRDCFNFPFGQMDLGKLTGEERVNLENCPLDAEAVTEAADWATFEKDLSGTTFYYDEAMGMLFLNIVQHKPNATAPTPNSIDENDPSISGLPDGFHFYSCPPEGSVLYTIRLDPSSYTIGGATQCECYGAPDPAKRERDYTVKEYPKYDYMLARIPDENIDHPLHHNILECKTVLGKPIMVDDIEEVMNTKNGIDYPFKRIKPIIADKQPHCPETSGVINDSAGND